jgi:PhnB protein
MMSTDVNPVPEGFHSVTPYLCVSGAVEAIEFYKTAFDAEELLRIPSPDGSIGHAEIQIGDSKIMISDESAEMDF